LGCKKRLLTFLFHAGLDFVFSAFLRVFIGLFCGLSGGIRIGFVVGSVLSVYLLLFD
jgi:hypothetical protein